MSISFPSSPVAGTSIYANGRQWTYDGTSWNLVLGGAYELQWTKTAVGGETTLTGASDVGTTLTYQLGNDNVYLNGVLMARNVDYTATTGNSITFTLALNPSDVVTVVSFNQLQLGSSNIATGTEPTTYTPGMVWVNTTGNAQGYNFPRWRLSAASSLTTLSGADDNSLTLSYTPGLEEVFINGALIVRGLDYTATNGTSIVLTVGVVAGDVIEVVNPMTATASTSIPSVTATAKGDILAATSSGVVSRLGVGTDGYLLIADSTQTTGLNWAQYPPRGTTAQRPSSPVIGDIYYDTTLGQMLNYTVNNTWVAVGTASPLLSTVTGGTLSSDATYYYRTFTSSGTLTVSNSSLMADILVVAGGGAGGSRGDRGGGGGGAGGVLGFASQALTANTGNTVIIGAGGASYTINTSPTSANNGNNSQFASLTASVGGGAGGSYTGVSGGSGGGGSGNNDAGGVGTSGQGTAGASGTGSGPYYAGGGGGAGAGGSGTTGGTGINTYTNATWLSTALSTTGLGVSGYIAGGGGGGATIVGGGYATPGTATAGGGAGASGNQSGSNGTANTGGGGGGGGGTTASGVVGGNGGSGVIIIRYTRSQVGG